eukprot:Rmarinus@m.7089
MELLASEPDLFPQVYCVTIGAPPTINAAAVRELTARFSNEKASTFFHVADMHDVVAFGYYSFCSSSFMNLFRSKEATDENIVNSFAMLFESWCLPGSYVRLKRVAEEGPTIDLGVKHVSSCSSEFAMEIRQRMKLDNHSSTAYVQNLHAALKSQTSDRHEDKFLPCNKFTFATVDE